MQVDVKEMKEDVKEVKVQGRASLRLQAQQMKILAEKTEADLSPIEHFGVQVLTTGHWPTYKGVDLSLPPLLAKCTQVFKEFYDTKHDHRRLTWVYQLGEATLRATYNKKYDLQVTTLQAISCLSVRTSS